MSSSLLVATDGNQMLESTCPEHRARTDHLGCSAEHKHSPIQATWSVWRRAVHALSATLGVVPKQPGNLLRM
ncbi:hypothetical protein GRJ2_000022000 [Grus japonensis]|uniref:Uncharacterized protein n=1 Tax=Grus japonensis TaxID=30415 RepID=A0ABC9VS98_GRUJA